MFWAASASSCTLHPEDPAKIDCNLEVAPNGTYCKNERFCLYRHANQDLYNKEQAKAANKGAGSSSATDAELCKGIEEDEYASRVRRLADACTTSSTARHQWSAHREDSQVSLGLGGHAPSYWNGLQRSTWDGWWNR